MLHNDGAQIDFVTDEEAIACFCGD